METCLLIKPKFELWQLKPGQYRVYALDGRLCSKLNGATGRYGDYKFRDGEEGIFYLNHAQLALLGLAQAYVSSLPQ